MKVPAFHPGDWVIYRKTKFSPQPGPRATNVAPAQHGDSYAYTVDKFWVVLQQVPSGQLTLQTRSGKRHLVDPQDARLRKANWWERWRYRDRFESILRGISTSGGDSSAAAGTLEQVTAP